MTVQSTQESSGNFAFDPLDWHQQAVNALLVSSALVALSDGRVDVFERDVATILINISLRQRCRDDTLPRNSSKAFVVLRTGTSWTW